MADADHALDFWTDVATTFKNDLGVVFELYNEPDFNVGNPPNISTNVDNDAAWQCWENGCTQNIVQWSQVDGGWVPQILGSYQTAGFQQLVNAVRTAEGNTAASHVILLGGVQYSNRLTQWAKYKPTDPANNLGAAWHIYNFNGCLLRTAASMASQPHLPLPTSSLQPSSAKMIAVARLSPLGCSGSTIIK